MTQVQAEKPIGHHTPGTWTNKEHSTYVWSKHGNVCACGDPHASGFVGYTECGPGSQFLNEAVANARLIAAAPDLDAAADEAWKALAWIINYDSEDKALASAMQRIEAARKKAGTYDYDAMRAQVEARALAKAEGR